MGVCGDPLDLLPWEGLTSRTQRSPGPLKTLRPISALAVLLAATAQGQSRPPDPASAQALAQPAAARVLGAALQGEGVFDLVRGLTDQVGPRLAGSPGADAAVRWAVAEMQRAGLRNVHTESVRALRWDRGPRAQEFARLLGPQGRELAVTALGGSIGGNVIAEVVEARSFDELRRLGRARVAGKLVLWNVEMVRHTDGTTNYGDVAEYRRLGAIEAARLGALASVVRSLGVASYRLPHTGAMRYEDGVQRIPAAALSTEDADLVHRLLQAGPVRVQLSLGCQNQGEVATANVIGEVPGQTDEIVLLGAHLDSWDLGTGAVDDGAGVALVVGAARALLHAGVTPRRTVRVVLFANEENGLRGAKAYAAAHQAELPRHVAAVEADSGAGAPQGFTTPTAEGVAVLREAIQPLRGLGAGSASRGNMGGADLSVMEDRLPIFHLLQENARYFEWHHTAADTLDKIDPVALNLSAAALAVAAYGLSQSERTLPRPAPAAAAR